MRDYAELIPVPGVGRLLLTDDWAFQLEPFYSDEVANAREVVYIKSTQVGASEAQLRWAVREADQLGRSVIYTFPTKGDVTEFTDTRMEPMIEESDYLRSRIPSHYVRTKTLKQIGTGHLSFRGSKSRAGAQSVAAQSLVFDEYEDLDQANLAQMERRLSGAKQIGKQPRIRRFGIPRVPGAGIDAHYSSSDRREYHVVCPACEVEQEVTWEDNVRWSVPPFEGTFQAGRDAPVTDKKAVGEAWRVCRECETSLEGKPIRTGRWVALNPEASVIGYRVHRLIVPGADLEELVRNSRQTKPHEVEAFYQNDLGLAYIGTDAALSEAAILQACALGYDPVDHYAGRLPVIAGLDVASTRDLNMTIQELQPDGTRKAVWIGMVSSFAEAARKMNAYRISCLAVDAQPERREAMDLAAMFPGRVFLVRYDWNIAAAAMSFDPTKSPVVSVNRTGAIDAMMDAIRGLRTIPVRTPPAGYVEQLQALKRRLAYTPKGDPYHTYISVGADDYGHAEAYAIVANEVFLTLRSAEEQAQAGARRPVKDEALGLRRLGLNSPSDDYRPGFGGADY